MRFAILLALIPFSRTALAQSFDILRQDITVDVASSTITSLDVAAELASDGSPEIWLLAPPLPIASLAIDGIEATVRSHPDYPGLVNVVELPRAHPPGEAFSLVMRASGDPICVSRLQPGTLTCVRNADQIVLVPPSPEAAWYLLNLFAFDPFVGSVTIRAPRDFETVAGQGAPSEIVETGDTITARYDFDLPTEALGLYAARANRVEAPGVVGLFTGDRAEKMQQAVDLAAELIPLYSERFGGALLDRATIVSIPRGFPFGGLGLIGTVFFGDYVVGELDYLLEQGTAHELAHTWWGGFASSADPAVAGFFNESFAEFSARWALGRVQGEAARAAGNRMNAVWYMYRRPNGGDIAVLDPNVRDSPLFVFVTYHKAPVVLATIESAMGEEAFTTALRRRIDRGPGGTSVATFLEDLAAAGYDASRDVREWLEQTGFPRATVSADNDDGNVALTIEVEGDFHFEIPARVHREDGSREELRLSLAPGRAMHSFEGEPLLIELDPGWTSVRELRATNGDVSFDGRTDGIDLIEIALRIGAYLPEERRRDGGYDPLYDLNEDRRIDALDLTAITGP